MRLFACALLCLWLWSSIVFAQTTALPTSVQLQRLQYANSTPDRSYSYKLDRANDLLQYASKDATVLPQVEQLLTEASRLAAPSPQWFVLMAGYHTATGEHQMADSVLSTAIAAYPYSARLHVAKGAKLLAEDAFASRTEILGLSMPEGARYLLAGQYAATHDDPVNAMLDLERAYYLAEVQVPQEQMLNRIVQTYFEHQQAGASCTAVHNSYSSGSFEHAYFESMKRVMHPIRAAQRQRAISDREDRYGQLIDELVDMRVKTLRHFAAEGHLGRFDDPLLIDLYVLDKAGYLRWSTEAMYRAHDLTSYRLFVDEQPVFAKAAKNYIANQWAADVDELLRLRAD